MIRESFWSDLADSWDRTTQSDEGIVTLWGGRKPLMYMNAKVWEKMQVDFARRAYQQLVEEIRNPTRERRGKPRFAALFLLCEAAAEALVRGDDRRVTILAGHRGV